VALASIVNSMELLDFLPREKRAFGKALMDWTGVDILSENSIIERTRMDLHRVFDCQSDHVMSRADADAGAVSVIKDKTKKKNHSLNSISSSRSPVDVENFTDFNNWSRSSSSSTTAATTSRRKKRGNRKPQQPSLTCIDGQAIIFERRVPLEP